MLQSPQQHPQQQQSLLLLLLLLRLPSRRGKKCRPARCVFVYTCSAQYDKQHSIINYMTKKMWILGMLGALHACRTKLVLGQPC